MLMSFPCYDLQLPLTIFLLLPYSVPSIATCHVYVDEAWVSKTGEKSAMEESMLDFAENVEPNSRLSCQIKVSDALEGLIVRMPESQH